MGQFQKGDIVEFKSTGPKMTITAVDDSSGEATCVWFEGKERQEATFDGATLRRVNHQKPDLRMYARRG